VTDPLDRPALEAVVPELADGEVIPARARARLRAGAATSGGERRARRAATAIVDELRPDLAQRGELREAWIAVVAGYLEGDDFT
jgi:hypothetical protein